MKYAGTSLRKQNPLHPLGHTWITIDDGVLTAIGSSFKNSYSDVSIPRQLLCNYKTCWTSANDHVINVSGQLSGCR